MTTTISSLSDELSLSAERASASVLKLHGCRRGAVSAFAWSPGLVVTAAHALAQSDSVELGRAEEQISAQVAGVDPATDLAVLRVDAELPQLPRARLESLRLGQLVLGLGRAGSAPRASLGVLSVVGGSWRLPGGSRLEQYVESDVRPFPGVSGGPLLTAAGELLGMNSTALVRSAMTLLPLASLERLVSTLVNHGAVRRAYLGVGTQAVRLPAALADEREQSSGLIVLSLSPGEPAARAGLLLGDVLLALDQTPLERVSDLASLLDESKIAGASVLDVLRAGKLERVTVEPRARGGAA
jgi:S1-C subfamily serine protease